MVGKAFSFIVMCLHMEGPPERLLRGPLVSFIYRLSSVREIRSFWPVRCISTK